MRQNRANGREGRRRTTAGFELPWLAGRSRNQAIGERTQKALRAMIERVERTTHDYGCPHFSMLL